MISRLTTAAVSNRYHPLYFGCVIFPSSYLLHPHHSDFPVTSHHPVIVVLDVFLSFCVCIAPEEERIWVAQLIVQHYFLDRNVHGEILLEFWPIYKLAVIGSPTNRDDHMSRAFSGNCESSAFHLKRMWERKTLLSHPNTSSLIVLTPLQLWSDAAK